MSANTRNTQEYLLACIGFSAAEADAARRLVTLLGINLKQPWRIAENGEDVDVALVNLDGEVGPDAYRHGNIAYCARKPGDHQQTALHLPLRSYELLKLLNTEAPAEAANQPSARSDDHAAWRYRLRAWPLQANDWTREHWQLMAAIRHRYCSVVDLALLTGTTTTWVQQCIDELDRLGALERNNTSARTGSTSIPASTATAPPGWRELAARVGQLFGFAR